MNWQELEDRDERARVAALEADVERLEAELESCRRRCEGLVERVAAQSYLLTKKAER